MFEFQAKCLNMVGYSPYLCLHEAVLTGKQMGMEKSVNFLEQIVDIYLNDAWNVTYNEVFYTQTILLLLVPNSRHVGYYSIGHYT